MSQCRLCLAEGAKRNIFDGSDPLATGIRLRCQIEVQKNDGLPEVICFLCANTLEKFFDFINVCLKSDQILREKLPRKVTKNLQKPAKIMSKNTKQYPSDVDFLELEIKNALDRINMSNAKRIRNVEDLKTLQPVRKWRKIRPSNGPTPKMVSWDESKIDRISKIIESHINSKLRNRLSKHTNATTVANIDLNNSQNLVDSPTDSITKDSAPGNLSTNNESNDLVEKQIACFKDSIPICEVTYEMETDVNNCEVIERFKPQIEVEKYFIPCLVCGKVLKDSASMRKHIKLHDLKKDHLCSICGKEFTCESRLREHELSHSNIKNYSCAECGRSFTTLPNCRKHVEMVHLKLRRTHCKVCDTYIYAPTTYKEHLKTHTNLKFDCDLCGKTFFSKSAIQSHIRTHSGDRPHACRYCPSKFSHSSSLLDHERLHTGETPYKCPVCQKGFAQRANMKSHFRHNHKDCDISLIYIRGARK